MTTSRINQVAFLSDTPTHTIPNVDETRGRDGHESRSHQAWMAQTRLSWGGDPRLASHFTMPACPKARQGAPP